MQSLSYPVFQSTFTHGFQRRKDLFSPLKREGKLKCANRNLGVAPNRSTNTPKTQIAPFRQHQPETPSLGQLIGQQVKETQRIPCHVLAKRHEVSTDCREEFNEPIHRHPKKSPRGNFLAVVLLSHTPARCGHLYTKGTSRICF